MIRKAVDRLKMAGVDTPRLDAEVMLAHVLGIKRTDLLFLNDIELTDTQLKQFEAMVDQRMQRKPVSQIINRRDFWTHSLYVDGNVLTPRPETEGIVERTLHLFPKNSKISVLDIGTGSGCIIAALADEMPNARFTAVDISPAALEVAKKNLEFAHNRVSLLQGNLFDALEESYDLIVSNPPYIPDNDIKTLPPEVRNYEPVQALSGGADGLAIIGQIAEDAPRCLSRGGWLIMEIGFNQAVAVKGILEKVGVYKSITFDKDLGGIERIVSAQI